MNFSQLKGKSVWITGASSGIGLEMAILAAEAGASLFLISSRKDALADAARLCSSKGASSVDFRAVDLSDSQVAADAVAHILKSHSAPNFLILNAGISQRAIAGETDLSVTKRIMDINFMGAVAVARAVLPAMVEAGGGKIGVTSSLVGEFGFPMRSAYSASKKALHGYFETVGLEYHSAGIGTTLVLPGRIRTPISTNALEGDGQRYEKLDPGQEKGMDPRRCAEKYWKAVVRGRHEKIIGGVDILMVFFHRYLPWLFRILARKTKPI